MISVYILEQAMSNLYEVQVKWIRLTWREMNALEMVAIITKTMFPDVTISAYIYAA